MPKHKHHKTDVKLLPAYPWEYIVDNVKTFRFIIMNFYTELFNPELVQTIAKYIEKFIAKYVYPSWRLKVEIQFFIPPSQKTLKNEGNLEGVFINAIPVVGTFIPIYLINEFSKNIPNNYATAIHGCVSGSPVNGYSASYYLDNNTYTFTGPLPFGTPFIVVPNGSKKTGNGINGLFEANKKSKDFGDLSYDQCLSLTLAHEIIEVLINPTGVSYIGGGNPLGLDEPVGTTTSQIFYIKEAVDPVSQGKDNIFVYKGWSMPNFVYPAYFFPYNTSGIYDFLGNVSAPLTPYKGKQFVIFQEAEGELQVGNYISQVSKPYTIQFVSYGSIYSYTGWGLKSANLLKHVNKSGPKNNKGGKISSITLKNCNNSKVIKSFTCKKSEKHFNKKHPQLLPFQYIDDDGFLTCRFVIINYIPKILDPKEINKTIPVMEKFMKESYLPYWNSNMKIIKNYTIYSDSDLPIFDGTFIPLFYLQLSQFNQKKLGNLASPGGALNLCNVPNILAGPLITEYLQATKHFSIPNLKHGNPYVLVSEANFIGEASDYNFFTIITTHEIQELASDPTYANYYLTSNPQVDNAVLFSQYEAADPVETFSMLSTDKKRSYQMSAFALPSYFVANMRFNNYDTTGTISRPLIPISRQQIVFQQKGNPLQVGNTFGYEEDGVNELLLQNNGNIFDKHTFYPPRNPPIPIVKISMSALASIYNKLETLNNVLLI